MDGNPPSRLASSGMLFVGIAHALLQQCAKVSIIGAAASGSH